MQRHTTDHAATLESIAELARLSALLMRVAKRDAETKNREEEQFVEEMVRVHFWKVAAHVYSIRRVLVKCCSERVLWDVSGVAALARVILDAALGIAYWRDDTHPDEFGVKCVLNVLHEKKREWDLLLAIGSAEHEAMAERASIVEEIGRGLDSNPLFQKGARFGGRLREAKKGDLPRLLKNGEIAQRAGLNVPNVDTTWRVLSSHVHAHPHAVSWLRSFSAADADSARLLGAFIRFATFYASWSAIEFIAQFPSCADAIKEHEHERLELNASMLRVDLASI